LQAYYETIATDVEPIELNIMRSTKYTVSVNTYPPEKLQDSLAGCSNHRLSIILLTFASITNTSSDTYYGRVMQELASVQIPVMLDFTCGQKITPMRVREIMQPFDDNLSVWRELNICQLVSDLVINFIAPSFPIHGQWVYLEGVTGMIFDSEYIKIKYNNSKASELVVQNIKAAKSVAHIDPKLADHLRLDIEYAQEKIMMSNVVMLNLTEHVGYPFDPAAATIGNLFEAVYSVHCMHTKLNIVHTNINPSHIMHRRQTIPPVQSPSTLYSIGPMGEHDTYIVPTTDIGVCLLDCTYCVCGPKFTLFSRPRNIQYIENFYTDQVDRIHDAINIEAPTWVIENSKKLKLAITYKYDILYPVICALDIIAIARCFDKCADKLATRVAADLLILGRTYLIDGLNSIITDTYVEHVVVFPGEQAIRELFKQFIFVNSGTAYTIIDAYNYNGDLKYSGADYAKFPQWAKLDLIKKNIGELKLSDVFDYQLKPGYHCDERISPLAAEMSATQKIN
jgi:hypothetical protein